MVIEGILDSTPAGKLIYMALVDLIAAEFLSKRMKSNFGDKKLRLGCWRRKVHDQNQQVAEIAPTSITLEEEENPNQLKEQTSGQGKRKGVHRDGEDMLRGHEERSRKGQGTMWPGIDRDCLDKGTTTGFCKDNVGSRGSLDGNSKEKTGLQEIWC
ncbi:hypothetical protein Tco_1328809 [Tanacetum coccineum]